MGRHFLNFNPEIQGELKEIAGAYKDILNDDIRIETELNCWKRIYIDAVQACAS